LQGLIVVALRVVVLLAGLAALSCRSAGMGGQPPIVQPGPPGTSSRQVDPLKAADLSAVQFTDADVRFMQGMIGHHAQAVEMVELLETRTPSSGMRLLGRRIRDSQVDEIRMMQEWLTLRGQALPDPHAHHAPGAKLMPGMLTQEEMGRLAAASGTAFDRLFLEFMIKHHAGALAMVEELFSQPRAGQEAEIFAFASDVEADQRMEIERMGAMLVTMKEPPR
jgi:uncharacterized protein (DUF305 family)